MITKKLNCLLAILMPLLCAGCSSLHRASDESSIAHSNDDDDYTLLFKTGEDLIPDHVKKLTRGQIQSYLPDQNFDSVPLLDPKIDWNKFENWPDQFVFQGETYNLRLVDCSAGDYFVELGSRNEVRPGMNLLANYRKEGTTVRGALRPSCNWLEDGTLLDKILDYGIHRVYAYKFYPSGRVFCFTRDDFFTREYRLEYFDRDGKLVGVNAHADGKGPGYYEWRGKKVKEDTFNKRRSKL